MTKDEALKKLQAVKAYMTSGNPIWDVKEIAEAFDMAIEALSASETEMKTGKWEQESDSLWKAKWNRWKCSACGKHISVNYDCDPIKAGVKFCPHCGSYNGGNNDDNS